MAGQGIVQGFGDIMKLWKGDPIATLGIGALLFYGVYKMFKQFGFLGGIAGFLGLWAINNWEKIGDNLSGLWDVAKKTAAKVEEGIDHLRWKTWSSASPDKPAESSEKPAEVTEDQKYLREKVMQNASVIASVNRVSQNAEKNKKPETGKMEDYLQFIETDLKDKPLNQLFPQDHKESIFWDTHKTSFSVPPNLNAKILKEVIRAYLGGDNMDRLFGTGDTRGVSDKENFFKTYSITAEDIKNKTLSDILAQVHQKRSSAWTQSSPTQPTSSPTQPTTSQPQSSPANDVPIAASAKLIVDGKNISSGDQLKMKLKAQVFDEQGNNSQIGRLPKDSKGNAYLDQDRVVIVTGKVITVKGITLAEATYAWQQIYVSPQHLKGMAS